MQAKESKATAVNRNQKDLTESDGKRRPCTGKCEADSSKSWLAHSTKMHYTTPTRKKN